MRRAAGLLRVWVAAGFAWEVGIAATRIPGSSSGQVPAFSVKGEEEGQRAWGRDRGLGVRVDPGGGLRGRRAGQRCGFGEGGSGEGRGVGEEG